MCCLHHTFAFPSHASISDTRLQFCYFKTARVQYYTIHYTCFRITGYRYLVTVWCIEPMHISDM